MHLLSRLVLGLTAVVLVAVLIPPATPAAAQIAGPCSIFAGDLYAGDDMEVEDNGDSYWITGRVLTKHRPTETVRAELKHVFSLRPDDVLRKGTATWRPYSYIETPFDRGDKYELVFSASVPKDHQSFRGHSAANVRVVFYWKSGRSDYEDGTCAAELSL